VTGIKINTSTGSTASNVSIPTVSSIGNAPVTSTSTNITADIVVEKKGDLFSCHDTASLGHCISRDLGMGKGIALLFKKKFGGLSELKEQSKGIGDVAILKRGKRFVYNMITKDRYFHKPTYSDLRSSLVQIRLHAEKSGVRELCMPRIGCGLDGLLWPNVKAMLNEVFCSSKVTVTIYTI